MSCVKCFQDKVTADAICFAEVKTIAEEKDMRKSKRPKQQASTHARGTAFISVNFGSFLTENQQKQIKYI